MLKRFYYPTDFLASINSEPKCTSYNTEIVDLLKNKEGVLVDVKDIYGNSPLYYAINSQNYLFIEDLIKMNAKILNIRNNDRLNPFEYVLSKLESICNFFNPKKNLISEMNKYYTIGLQSLETLC